MIPFRHTPKHVFEPARLDSNLGLKFSLIYMIGAILMGLPTYAQTLSSSELQIEPLQRRSTRHEWSMLLGGASLVEGKDEAAGAFLWVDAHFEFDLIETLKVVLHPRASFYSSRVQERFDDDTFQNELGLYEGYAAYAPISFFEARVGALGQKHHGTGMLISGNRSFPGLQEILSAPTVREVKAKLILQQAVPTSHSLNTERMEQEKLPSFTTETLSLEGKNFGWLEWQANGGHFRWGNVPAKVIFKSRRLGNDGEGDLVPDSRLFYEHEGWFGATEFCVCTPSRLKLVVEFERIHNTAAPNDSADGQVAGVGPRIHFGDRVLDLRYRSFFMESEVSVASYTKSSYGHTNRIGQNIEARLDFKDKGFAVFAEYTKSEPLSADPFQRELTSFYLGLETEYASF